MEWRAIHTVKRSVQPGLLIYGGTTLASAWHGTAWQSTAWHDTCQQRVCACAPHGMARHVHRMAPHSTACAPHGTT
eukprot:364750-Chlamydomonas_euryale.AAC.18